MRPHAGAGVSAPTVPPTVLQHLEHNVKMMSRRKMLLLLLGASTVSLLIHQGAQLRW